VLPLTVIMAFEGALLNSLTWKGSKLSAAAVAKGFGEVIPLDDMAVFEAVLVGISEVEGYMDVAAVEGKTTDGGYLVVSSTLFTCDLLILSGSE